MSEDFFDPSEEDMIKNFDSRKTRPHLIFLGLDESRKADSLKWNIYTGTPCFALDVTPRGSEDQQASAKDIISTMEAKGLDFFKSRVVMTLSADEGWLASFRPVFVFVTAGLLKSCSRHLCTGPRSP